MATLYVDPDASGAGNGTSWANAWTSMSAAVAAIDDAALTEDTTVLCRASSATVDTTAVAFLNINTTADYRLTFSDHDGTYALTVSSLPMDFDRAFGGYYNITIEGLAITRTSTANYSSVMDITNLRDQGEIRIMGCRLEVSAGAYRARSIVLGFDGDTYTSRVVFANNLIIDNTTASHPVAAIVYCNSDPDAVFYNNTFIGNTSGAPNALSGAAEANNLQFKNNIFEDCYDSGEEDPGVTDYNAFSEAFDFGGGNSRNGQTFTFVDTTDYRLASGDAGAKDFGTDLSADGIYAFDDDIDGNTRSGSWDIGCSEYVAAGGAAPTSALSGPLGGPLVGVF